MLKVLSLLVVSSTSFRSSIHPNALHLRLVLQDPLLRWDKLSFVQCLVFPVFFSSSGFWFSFCPLFFFVFLFFALLVSGQTFLCFFFLAR